jgi:hypothetical protein
MFSRISRKPNHRRARLLLATAAASLSLVGLLACDAERQLGDGTITEPSAPWINLALVEDDIYGSQVTVPANTWYFAVVVSWSADYNGDIKLSVEGTLPPGVTAVFDPPVPFTARKANYRLTVTATPEVPTTSTSLTIRAKGTGVPDATVVLPLTIGVHLTG